VISSQPFHKTGQKNENDRKGPVIQRKDPQAATHEEVWPPAGLSLGIEQDSRDQKPREHEKEVDTSPAETADGGHRGVDRRGRLERKRDRVPEEHEQDGRA